MLKWNASILNSTQFSWFIQGGTLKHCLIWGGGTHSVWSSVLQRPHLQRRVDLWKSYLPTSVYESFFFFLREISKQDPRTLRSAWEKSFTTLSWAHPNRESTSTLAEPDKLLINEMLQYKRAAKHIVFPAFHSWHSQSILKIHFSLLMMHHVIQAESKSAPIHLCIRYIGIQTLNLQQSKP